MGLDPMRVPIGLFSPADGLGLQRKYNGPYRLYVSIALNTCRCIVFNMPEIIMIQVPDL